MNIREDTIQCASELEFIFEHIENGDMAPKELAEQGKEVCRRIMDLTPNMSARGTIDEI